MVEQMSDDEVSEHYYGLLHSGVGQLQILLMEDRSDVIKMTEQIYDLVDLNALARRNGYRVKLVVERVPNLHPPQQSRCSHTRSWKLLTNRGMQQMSDPVFVFGSNLAGRHGAGAALWARHNRGAIYGHGEGMQGNSYAIPTKDANLKTLPLDTIANHVVYFLEYALSHPELTFQVTPIGCGLAGYKPKDIAWMFDAPCPRNVVLPPEFTAS